MELLAKDAALFTMLTASSGKTTATPEDYGLTADDVTALAMKVTAARNAMQERRSQSRDVEYSSLLLSCRAESRHLSNLAFN
jgi:hypothetical protein